MTYSDIGGGGVGNSDSPVFDQKIRNFMIAQFYEIHRFESLKLKTLCSLASPHGDGSTRIHYFHPMYIFLFSSSYLHDFILLLFQTHFPEKVKEKLIYI